MAERVEDSFEITVNGKEDAYTVAARAPGVLTEPAPFKWPPEGLSEPSMAIMRLSMAFEITADYLKEVGGALYKAMFPERWMMPIKSLSGAANRSAYA